MTARVQQPYSLALDRLTQLLPIQNAQRTRLVVDQLLPVHQPIKKRRSSAVDGSGLAQSQLALLEVRSHFAELLPLSETSDFWTL